LAARGWEVLHQDDMDLVIAQHGTEVLVAEVQAETDHPGEDMDRLYGRLLRRVVDYPDAHLAGVVPERLRGYAGRVPASVRQRLFLDIYLVSDLGSVHRLRSDPPDAADAAGAQRLVTALAALGPTTETPGPSSVPRARRAELQE